MNETLTALALDYPHHTIGHGLLVHADCMTWLERIPPESLHAIVTDPPYGVKEYELEQLAKREAGNGGIWRIPPSFDGHTRAPLPRFTALTDKELDTLRVFFTEWARRVVVALRPGGHVFIASNAYLSQVVFGALAGGGLEFRGEIIRLVRTLRGGDRPKNAETEYPDVSTMPRGGYEPWGLFRKPMLTGMRVSDCLKTYGTGGLRRNPDGSPFSDVIASERTPKQEREIAPHPTLKPQSLLRRLVYAALPLGEGVIADPFMGSGSTVAAANALGLACVGVERHDAYYALAVGAVPRLAEVAVALSTPAEQLSLLEP